MITGKLRHLEMRDVKGLIGERGRKWSGGNLVVGVSGKHTSTRGVTRGYVHIDPQGCTRGLQEGAK